VEVEGSTPVGVEASSGSVEGLSWGSNSGFDVFLSSGDVSFGASADNLLNSF
jgi:hypothetical protein